MLAQGPCVAIRGLLVFVVLAMPAKARAASLFPDSASGIIGYSSGPAVAIYGVGASWYISTRNAARDESGLTIRVEGELNYWKGKGRPTPYGHVWDVNAAPMLRWTFERPAAPRLFVEGGVGVHLLSTTRINNDRIFSTALQLGEVLAVGVAFGHNNAYEVRLFGQHVSDGGIKLPNWGLTYPGIALSVALP